MAITQGLKSIQGQVVESNLEEPIEASTQSIVYMPIVVTTTFSVPHTYLYNVESNTGYIREKLEDIAFDLEATVSSVDIK
jgi:hypothetical protein